MRRLRDNRGFTLVELLVAMSLLSVVIGAVTSAFVAFSKNERTNQKLNDSQDQARTTVGRFARELRNLASPTDNKPEAIDRAGTYDLIFRTVAATKPSASNNDRNVKRVRYCLSESENGSAKLWAHEQTWTTDTTPDTPESSSCPSESWETKTVIAENIVNREAGRPLFDFRPATSPTTAIFAIATELHVDVTPGKLPAPTKLSSGVFLRNQNRAPVPSCTAVYTGIGRQILLNGSASHDPEGRSIRKYEWLHDGSVVGTGAYFVWTPTAAGTYNVRLRVTDYGLLPGEANCAQPAVVP